VQALRVREERSEGLFQLLGELLDDLRVVPVAVVRPPPLLSYGVEEGRCGPQYFSPDCGRSPLL
jgi:hypothetical protein